MLSSDEDVDSLKMHIANHKDAKINHIKENANSHVTTQPLLLGGNFSKGINVSVPIPLYHTAETIRDTLTDVSSLENNELSQHHMEIIYMSHLIEFSINTYNDNQLMLHDVLGVVHLFFTSYNERFFSENDVHVVVKSLDPDLRDHVIRVYYTCRTLLRKCGFSLPNKKSAILEAAKQGKVNLFASFGGQGNVEDYFEELTLMFRTYYPLVVYFLNQCALVLAKHSTHPDAVSQNAIKIDVMTWLDISEKGLKAEKMLEPHLSLPLIALTQLTAYYLTLKILDIEPSDLRDVFVGTTGHSQGIVSSVVISASDTESEFVKNTQKALGLLFWLGLRSEKVFPQVTLNYNIIRNSLDHNENVPTPMLSVTGLPRAYAVQVANDVNKYLPPHKKVYPALYNGPRSTIFSGPPESLCSLNVHLRELKGSTSAENSKIPFSERKLSFNTRFIPVAVPFHSPYLDEVVDIFLLDVAVHRLNFDVESLAIPVYHTRTGNDMRLDKTCSIASSLASQICSQQVHWELATDFKAQAKSLNRTQSVSHFLDFGPGKQSGIGSLTYRNTEGCGVQVIIAGSYIPQSVVVPTGFLDKVTIFDTKSSNITFADDWAKSYCPKLVRTKKYYYDVSTHDKVINNQNTTIHLDTKFSRLIAKPPIMIAGMTPTTCGSSLVIAATNAGLHIEWAGGGQHCEKLFRSRLNEILNNVTPGRGVNINMLFLNPRLWSFQFSLVQSLRKSGIPIEGVCVAAGVPTQEVSDNIVYSLKEVGIKHISFKPSSAATIRDVVSIAKRHPEMPIIIQWTGGRAGGHHSYEDFHQPLLETYSIIRRVKNLVLVVGSGFGDCEGSYPYLSGEWSNAYGYPPMPVDGILIGSCAMVAKEASTAEAVKQLIVSTPGIENEIDWVKSYKGPAGGIMTIISELHEPIHVIASRGAIFWKEMQELVFKHRGKERLAIALANKDYIIEGLNKHYQKPWFGLRSDGKPCEISEMSNYEVISRYMSLVYVKKPKTTPRWIDRSYAKTAYDFMGRSEERFISSATVSTLGKYEDFVKNPFEVIGNMFSKLPPESKTQHVAVEDILYFLSLLKTRGRKPPPFIPTLDEEIETWFKKDSLWQSEDLEAVVDEDPQRTIILQGPMAVRYSKKANVPIKDMIQDIYQGYISKLKDKLSQNELENISLVNSLDYKNVFNTLPPQNSVSSAIPGIKFSKLESGTIMYEVTSIASDIPDIDLFLNYLVSGFSPGNWLSALLLSNEIVQDGVLVDNYVKKVFRPRPDQTIFVKNRSENDSEPMFIAIYDRQPVKALPDPNPSVITSYDKDVIVVTIYYMVLNVRHSLEFHFEYKPWFGPNLIHEDMRGRNQRIKDFYSKIWSVDGSNDIDVHTIPFLDQIPSFQLPNHKEYTHRYKIDPQLASDYCKIIFNRASIYSQNPSPCPPAELDTPVTDREIKLPPVRTFKLTKRAAPMDMAIIAGWKAIISAILPSWIDGDLLRLVHLSNSFRMLYENPMEKGLLFVGDELVTKAFVRSITVNDSGKTIEVQATVSREEKDSGGSIKCSPLVKIVTSFLCKGNFSYDNTFKLFEEKPMKLVLHKKADVVLLLSKKWIKWKLPVDGPDNDPAKSLHGVLVTGSVILFNLYTYERYKGNKQLSVLKTSGSVELQTTRGLVHVGNVDYVGLDVHGNIVMDYLNRHGSSIEEVIPLGNGPYNIITSESAATVSVPASSQAYSNISGDFNPVHTNPYFADMARLPGTILHGMWTSAAVRKFVEIFGAESKIHRVRSYDVKFKDIVMPGDLLDTRIMHTAMINGRKLLKVEVVNQHGDVVLEGTSEVEQAVTSYVFTGQGSQEVGMGMELFESSPVAREVWENADRYMIESYGVSIIEIVRKNPKSKTVYFGGKLGKKIRQNYISMTYDISTPDGKYESLPLFPGLDNDTQSYTFQHPEGLLYATQFTQPALTLMEYAQFEDMKSKGLIQESSVFAGHSLGEYAALASSGLIISLEALVHVVFYRGVTMQVSVPRDANGNSDYGMVSINPSRVSKMLTENRLKNLVNSISKYNNGLLEIVNYNIESQQYVASGDLRNLEFLRLALNKMYEIPRTSPHWKSFDSTELNSDIKSLLCECEKVIDSKIKQQKGERLTLDRGIATIPLPGIDVPFHSSSLLQGVAPFREILMDKIDKKLINVSKLINKYIPNVTGKPFDITHEYIEYIYSIIKSEILKNLLDNWNKHDTGDPTTLQDIGHCLVVELLSYQFASSVRWIETQDTMFRDLGVERLIEISPSPILCNMAKRTIKAKNKVYNDDLTLGGTQLCASKNAKEVYYLFNERNNDEIRSEVIVPQENVEKISNVAPTNGVNNSKEIANAVEQQSLPQKAEPVSPTQPAPPVLQAPPSDNSSVQIPDASVPCLDVIIAIVSVKLRRNITEAERKKSLRDISAGKSTFLNEIIGDLGQEFPNIQMSDTLADMPIEEVGAQFDSSTPPNYNIGQVTRGMVSKLISTKLPGTVGMKRLVEYLTEEYGLQQGRINGILLELLQHEPPKRISTDVLALEWVDYVVSSYSKAKNIDIKRKQSGQSGTNAQYALAFDNELFKKHQVKLDTMVSDQMRIASDYLGVNLLEHYFNLETKTSELKLLQTQLDLWIEEHGADYGRGIAPCFDQLKVRIYDSFWNWVYQDTFRLYYDVVLKGDDLESSSTMEACHHILNRSIPGGRIADLLNYLANQCANKYSVNDTRCIFLRNFAERCANSINENPKYLEISYVPLAPKTSIGEKGDITYGELPRDNMNNMNDYVAELARGSKINMPKATIISERVEMLQDMLIQLEQNAIEGRTDKDKFLKPKIDAVFADLKRIASEKMSNFSKSIPFVYLKSINHAPPYEYELDSNLTKLYLDVLSSIANNGISFKGRNVLITGCGRGSIGVELVKALIAGGASLVVTTSKLSKTATDYYRKIYEDYGSKYSRLVIVPYNAGSYKDTKNLVDYIYTPEDAGGLGWDLDFIIPFAAIPEKNREIENIDSYSELAHRVMLVNVFRLIGEVSKKKDSEISIARPASVILPLSHNHGVFGGDGLYSESKVSLETLLKRFHSESWNKKITIIGAIIGWTRGTALMSASNLIAEGIEKLGARTFTTHEMAFNLIGLLHPSIIDVSSNCPVVADLNGGFDRVPDTHSLVKSVRQNLYEESSLKSSLFDDVIFDNKTIYGEKGTMASKDDIVKPRANMKFEFPPLPEYVENYPYKNMLDLDRVIVVAGFGEVCSWGNQRTRWEMEKNGEFTLEGVIEMAWMMGFIKFHHGPLPEIDFYSGWIDTKTKKPLDDSDILNFVPDIISGSGIRIIEPQTSCGYNPEKKEFISEISVSKDLPPIETTEENARAFKRYHNDSVDVVCKGGSWYITLRKGATVYVPKSIVASRLVAGQVPRGWDVRRYGISENLYKQADPVTHYTLVSTIEALLSAGITDPYEFYEHVHVSNIGTCTGGGMGGVLSIQKMFVDRRLEKEVPSDILQETFINTMAAWVNMSLLSSSGPVKIPVGACATALCSLDIGCDTILSGKAKIMFCGGFDDFGEEGSYEFGSMKATSSTNEELKKGREPSEMCRPASDTRAGFMESYGAGVQIVTTAALALKMGLPIYGIISHTATATDKQGKSVPAPGQGILTSAREKKTSIPSPLLDIDYRYEQLSRERERIKKWLDIEYNKSIQKIVDMRREGKSDEEIKKYSDFNAAFIQKESKRSEKAALSMWSHDFWQDDETISPIKGSLAVYGLTIDDINAASYHGTGTVANDYNESSVLFQQLEHIGRTKGNLIISAYQKHLTGHPKGAAGAWMLNGVLQMLNSGAIPGNKNLDNVDQKLMKFDSIAHVSRTIQTDGLNSVLLKSFGFGQAGGEALVIHPRYLFRCLEETQYRDYAAKLSYRQEMSYKGYHKMLVGLESAIGMKESAPYKLEDQSWVYLNPMARAKYNPSLKTWDFNSRFNETDGNLDPETANMISDASKVLYGSSTDGVGTDIQLISDIARCNDNFIKRNFTESEIRYCKNSPDPPSSFSGRWAAKEAIFKAINNYGENSTREKYTQNSVTLSLNEIEITRVEGCAPTVTLHKSMMEIAETLGINNIKVSISHSGSYSIAIAKASS